jgi:hypothetical protein
VAIEINIWIYWMFCAIATWVIISNGQFVEKLLSPDVNTNPKKHHQVVFLIISWLLTFLASATYILFTIKQETGSYKLIDLIVFAFLNGILEQFMFIFWFLLGCYLVWPRFRDRAIIRFIVGYVSYFLYSGAIHTLFWLQVLPEHDPFTPVVLILSVMSLVWMWLFWRYRTIVPILAMHIVVDFLAIGHLHFNWFESFQLI